ncbi:MAG TPA: energy-coupling factor transporter ATPase, partial [Ruminococcus sp.]|nr:energy-coupling factor transporter ATPase [Ruminococcus sp.]
DEPTAGLDPRGREEILQEIQAYRNQTGATILLVSHSMEDVA